MAEMDLDARLERLAEVRARAAAACAAIEGFDRIVEEYIEVSSEPTTRFGYRAVGYLNFVQLLRRGRKFQGPTMVRVLAYIAGQSAPNV